MSGGDKMGMWYNERNEKQYYINMLEDAKKIAEKAQLKEDCVIAAVFDKIAMPLSALVKEEVEAEFREKSGKQNLEGKLAKRYLGKHDKNAEII